MYYRKLNSIGCSYTIAESGKPPQQLHQMGLPHHGCGQSTLNDVIYCNVSLDDSFYGYINRKSFITEKKVFNTPKQSSPSLIGDMTVNSKLYVLPSPTLPKRKHCLQGVIETKFKQVGPNKNIYNPFKSNEILGFCTSFPSLKPS